MINVSVCWTCTCLRDDVDRISTCPLDENALVPGSRIYAYRRSRILTPFLIACFVFFSLILGGNKHGWHQFYPTNKCNTDSPTKSYTAELYTHNHIKLLQALQLPSICANPKIRVYIQETVLPFPCPVPTQMNLIIHGSLPPFPTQPSHPYQNIND